MQTPPKMVQTRRKGTARIEDPKKRNTAFSKRRIGLFRKVTDLCQITDAQVAVIAFSAAGKLYSDGKPSVEEIIYKYLRHRGDVMPPMSQRELEDWAKKECESCTTWGDLVSSIMKHKFVLTKEKFVLDCLLKKLKDFENNPSVKAGAGNDSGVGVDRSSKVSNDDEEIYDGLEDLVELLDLDVSM